jgi:hypothetical protein
MGAAESIRTTHQTLSVVASFSAYPTPLRPPRCRAFLFSHHGVLLGSEQLDGEGRACLRWSGRTRERLHLLLAPATIPTGMLSEEQLLRRLREFGAVDRVLPVDRLHGEIVVPVEMMRWRDWLARTDCISGRLQAAGDDGERGVGGVRVELHAVTPLQSALADLSAEAITHVRQLLLHGLSPLQIYRPSRHVADAPTVTFADIERLRSAPGFELLTSAARLQSDAAFRQLLGNYPAIARPLLCYYHPCSFTSSCVASTLSDAAGMFRFPVLRHSDPATEPGYHFVARCAVSSTLLVALYEPAPVSWYTHWDLSGCASSITLRSSHPLALVERVPA